MTISGSVICTLERVMLKRIASDAVEDQNDEIKAQILQEIDDAPMSAEREQQEQHDADITVSKLEENSRGRAGL